MKDIDIKIYYAKETKILRKKLKDGSFFKDNNKFYVDDLFSDTKISENKCKLKKPRIGNNYQINITNQ